MTSLFFCWIHYDSWDLTSGPQIVVVGGSIKKSLRNGNEWLCFISMQLESSKWKRISLSNPDNETVKPTDIVGLSLLSSWCLTYGYTGDTLLPLPNIQWANLKHPYNSTLQTTVCSHYLGKHFQHLLFGWTVLVWFILVLFITTNRGPQSSLWSSNFALFCLNWRDEETSVWFGWYSTQALQMHVVSQGRPMNGSWAHLQ